MILGIIPPEMVPTLIISFASAELISEIAAASEEQSDGVSQMNNSVHQVAEGIQQNASASEQFARTAENLFNNANELKDETKHFTI